MAKQGLDIAPLPRKAKATTTSEKPTASKTKPTKQVKPKVVEEASRSVPLLGCTRYWAQPPDMSVVI